MSSCNCCMNPGTVSQLGRYKGKIFVVKYGGSIMENTAAQEAFVEDVALLDSLGIRLVVVHGGGPEITRWLKKAGIANRFVKGLRVTDSDTMEIAEMVLSGSINKRLSSVLSLKGLKAVGLSGKDSGLIQARKKYVVDGGNTLDLGFVGEVADINTKVLLELLGIGYIPVISPIGYDAEGNSYNINADYAAASISGALEAEKLLIMTDIDGVYTDINDPSTLLPSITKEEIARLVEAGAVSGGMIPKLECCTAAIEKGTKNVHLIDGRKLHGLLTGMSDGGGTKITAGREVEQCQKIV